MNAALRQQIRHAIDTRMREHRQAFIDAGELTICAGCGGDLDMRTTGCKTCADRHLRRGRRFDPALLEKERARQQRARERRSACQKARRQQQKSVEKSRPLSVKRSSCTPHSTEEAA